MFFVVKRKNLLLYISIVIILLGVISAYARYANEDFTDFDGKTIIIDPGHGGIDGGAVGKNGTLEKDLNLKLSLELEKQLKKDGYEVVMTRNEDKLTYESKDSSNKKRADTRYRLNISREHPNGLFISIHMNHFEDSGVKGSQIFYSVKNPQSKKLAEILKQTLIKNVDSNNKREIKEAYPSIYIMKNIKNPAILIECGFISNREEEKLLNSEEYRSKIVTAISEALKEYKKGNDN